MSTFRRIKFGSLLTLYGFLFGLLLLALTVPQHTSALGTPVAITSPTNAQSLTSASPVITGTGPANKKIQIYIDGSVVIASVQIDSAGAWSHTATGLSEGSHTVRVALLDGTALLSNSSGVNSFGRYDLNSGAVNGASSGICQITDTKIDTTNNKIFLLDACSNQIHVFDTATRTFTTSISLQSFNAQFANMSLDMVSNRLYISGKILTGGGIVVKINSSTNSVISSVNSSSGGYYNIAANPAENVMYLYTTNPVISTLDVYSKTTDIITATAINANITSFKLTPNGQYCFYMVSGDYTHIYRFNTSSKTVDGSITYGTNIIGYVMSADSSKIYVSNNSSAVSVYGTSGLASSVTVNNAGSSMMSLNPASTRLYGRNSVLNTSTNTVVASALTGGEHYADPTGSFMYEAVGSTFDGYGSTTIKVYNANSGAVITTINGLRAGTGSGGIYFSASGTVAYTVNRFDKSISLFDTSNHTLINHYNNGTEGTGTIVLNGNGTKAYSTSVSSSVVQVINTNNNALITSIHLAGIMESSGGGRTLYMNPAGTYLYAYIEDWNSTKTSKIVKIDTSTDTVVATTTVVGAPQSASMVVNEAESSAYISSFSGGVKQINLSTGATTRTIGAGIFTQGTGRMLFNSNFTKLYIASSAYQSAGVVGYMDVTTHVITTTVSGAYSVTDIAMSNDGTVVYEWIVSGVNNSLITMTSSLGSIGQSQAWSGSNVGATLAVAPNNYALALSGNTIQVIDGSTLKSLSVSYTYNFTSPLSTDLTNLSSAVILPSGLQYSEASVTFNVLVPVSMTNPNLPDGQINESYSAQYQAINVHGSATFSLASGALPPGISLSSSGLVSGTPTLLGHYNFNVSVTDNSTSSTVNSSIVITSAKPADSLLGQIDGSQNPVWGNYSRNNSTPNRNAIGFEYPQAIVTDTVNHRLFVGECGSRISVFNLNSSNKLVDKVADYVIGQPDLSSSAYDSNATDEKTINCVEGMAFDSVRQLLFVSDSYNSRILIFDVSSMSDGKSASYVLGQTNFTSTASNPTAQNTLSYAADLEYDQATKRLYVADSYNYRVLIFDTTTLSNNMNAAYVLGQPDFSSNGWGTSSTNMDTPYGIAIDGNKLFIADSSNCRVLVYDISSISNGMAASNVLGQPNFTAHSCSNVTNNSLTYPNDITINKNNHNLFVSDSNNRVLVFDTSSITDGMAARAVLGQGSFTGSGYGHSRYSINGPYGLYSDDQNMMLYVSDTNNHRVVQYDLAIAINPVTLSNGTVGDTYSQQISSIATFSNTSLSVVSGSLPLGTTLNSQGLLSGTLTTVGSYTFTVKNINDWGSAGSIDSLKEYTVVISAVPPQSSQPLTVVSSPSVNTSVAVALTEVISLEPITTFATSGTQLTVSESQVYSFVVTETQTNQAVPVSENHTVTIDFIGPDYIDLTISSDPIHLRLYVGQSKDVDVNKDGVTDIFVKLDSITKNTASLFVKKTINTTVTAKHVTQKQIVKSLTNASQVRAVVPGSSLKKQLLLLSCAVVLCICTGIALVKKNNKTV